jgi:uncharacterized protein YegL
MAPVLAAGIAISGFMVPANAADDGSTTTSTTAATTDAATPPAEPTETDSATTTEGTSTDTATPDATPTDAASEPPVAPPADTDSTSPTDPPVQAPAPKTQSLAAAPLDAVGQDVSIQAVTCNPGSGTACLSVTKNVVNTGGGTATASDWSFTVQQQSRECERSSCSRNSHWTDWSDTSTVATFHSGDSSAFLIGAGSGNSGTDGDVQYRYNVTEDAGGPTGYSASVPGSCSNIVLATGQTRNCTITNTFVPPPTIVINAGGFRTGTSTVGPLPAGATFQAVPVGGGTTLTCTSVAAGTCTITNAVQGKQYDVSQTAAPSGWYSNPTLDYGDSASGNSTPYVFRTAALPGGTTYVPGQTADSNYSDARPSPGNPFLGQWATSVNDNPMPNKCGLNIAIVMDTSGSMGSKPSGSTKTKLQLLQESANNVVDALLPATSTQIALYTFGQSVGTPLYLTTNTTNLHNKINGLSANGGTNWDQGLHQVVGNNNGDVYDLVVVLTDGNPTYDHNSNGGGTNTRFNNISNAVFSANAIKNLTNTVGGKTRTVTIGIGVDGGDENIRAISGTELNSDYFLSSGSNFGDALLSTLLKNCSLTVTKKVQNPDGTIQVASGWNIDAKIGSASTQTKATDSNGNAVFGPLSSGNTTFTVTETQKSGFHLVPDGVSNLLCMQGSTTLAVTNIDSATQPGVSFSANPSNGGIQCTVVNSSLSSLTLT